MAESDLIRGNVDTIILKVLYEGDRYGYDLIRQINARGDGQWEIKQPTVYACLKRLEKQGFISSYWDSSESDGGRRKYYSLTESGRDVFLKYKSEFERASSLFGELITGDEPTEFIHPVDDYSDVEDDGYSLPKRRPKPRQRAKTTDTATSLTPEVAKQPTENDIAAEQDVAPEPSEQEILGQTQDQVANDWQQQYVQQDLFSFADNNAEEIKESVQDNPTDGAEILSESEGENTEQITDREVPSPRETVDPREIIDRYYAQETGESYSDVRKQSSFNEKPLPTERKTAPVAQAAQPVKQAPVPAPSPVKQEVAVKQEQSVKPVEPTTSAVMPFGFAEEESPARREYKTVLSDLVDRFEVSPPVMREQPTAQVQNEQAAVAAADSGEDRRFAKVMQAARDLGNDVQIRDHNDSAKEYNHKFYYYSNRLLMTHYTIMCVAMFILGLTLFLTFYLGFGMRMEYDYLLYIAAGLLPIILFIAAVIRFAGDPDKTKRINVNFRFSIFIRCIIMIQVAVVIYCLNLIWGMPIAFSADYIPSLIIPLAYALFIPISELIFMTLLKSGGYAAVEIQ